MLLGIPYHAARMFSSDWGPPQGVTSRFCEVVAQSITEFRMPAFFLIAGYFASMLLSRSDRDDWLRGRIIRLGIPLITATIIIIPLQLIVYSAQSSIDIAGLQSNWINRIHTPSQTWISHLWFLDDLIIYSILVAIFWPLIVIFQSLRLPLAFQRAPFGSLFVLVGLAALPLSFIDPVISGTFLGSMLARLLHNGVFFLLGAALFLQPDFLGRWLTWRWWRAGVIVAIIAVTVPLTIQGNHYRPAMVAGACSAIGGAWLVLAAMRQWGDAPSTRVKLFVDASLTIYLVHHPIILALGLFTATTAWPPELEWLAVTLITAMLSLGIYLISRQIPALYFLFNGQRLPNRRSAMVAA